jgi:esterase/lipase superfamily enzyme
VSFGCDWPSTARAWESLPFEEQQLYLMKARMFMNCQKYNPTTVRVETDVYCQSQKSSPFASPAEFLSWEIEQYDQDQSSAKSVGAPSLVALVKQLNAEYPGIVIDVVAHSMGCYVVQQMLRSSPALAEKIRDIIWLAPDVSYDVLEDDEVRKALHHIHGLYIFFARDDKVLRFASPVANRGWRLGAVGPKNMQTIPGNVTVCDLTDMLKNDHEIVHSMYLSIVGPVPQMVAEITLDRHFECPPIRKTGSN